MLAAPDGCVYFGRSKHAPLRLVLRRFWVRQGCIHTFGVTKILGAARVHPYVWCYEDFGCSRHASYVWCYEDFGRSNRAALRLVLGRFWAQQACAPTLIQGLLSGDPYWASAHGGWCLPYEALRVQVKKPFKVNRPNTGLGPMLSCA